MIKKHLRLCALAAIFTMNIAAFSSCKGDKKKDETTTAPVPEVTPAPMPAPAAPVVISADDSLKSMLVDATKDFPNVKTSVQDGVVTLTGEIQRSGLVKLMQSVSALHPKKIEKKELIIK